MKMSIEELETLAFLLKVGINDERHRCDGHPSKRCDAGEVLHARIETELENEKTIEEVRELKEQLEKAEAKVHFHASRGEEKRAELKGRGPGRRL